MKARWMSRRNGTLAALFGVALLAIQPVAAQADQGKWWNPGHGGTPPGQAKKQARDHGPGTPVVVEHGHGQGSYVTPTYYPPTGRFVATGPRYYRPYRGYRVYRDVVTVPRGYYAPGHWVPGAHVVRYYAYPTYYYPTRTVYVRPVRFYLSAVTGSGVSFSIGYGSPAYYYGCNFCGAEFSSYAAYHAHVLACPDRPVGYRVVCQDWSRDWHGDDGQGGNYQGQGNWSQDQNGYDQNGYDQNGYDQNGYDQ